MKNPFRCGNPYMGFLTCVFAVLCLSATAGTLPDAYRRVKCLEANGTQYLDTGVMAGPSTRLVMRFSYTTAEEGGGGIGYGANNAKQSFMFWRVIDSGTGNAVYRVTINNNYNAYDSYDTGAKPDTAAHVIDISNTAKSIDGHAFGMAGGLTQTLAGSLYLFGQQWGWNPKYGSPMKGRIYFCQIYDGETLLRDYVPCVRIKDGVAGLYDLSGKDTTQFRTILTKPAGDPLVARPLDGVTVSHTQSSVFSAEGFSPAVGFAEGAGHVICTAPAGEGTADDGKVKYTVTGWKLRLTDADGAVDESEGIGTNAEIDVPEDVKAELEWQLAPQYLVNVASGAGGVISPAKQWVSDGCVAVVSAAAESGRHFSIWKGNVPSESRRSLSFVVTEPIEATAVFGKSVHVAPAAQGGSDKDGDGTSGKPYATLAQGLSAAEGGDEIVLSAGDYAPASTVTVSTNVVIRGATGDPADVRVSGGSSRLVLLLEHADAVVRDLTLEKGSCGEKGTGTGARVTAGTLENCIVRGCTMGQRSNGIVYVNGANALVSGCVITNNFCDGGSGDGMGGSGGCVNVLNGAVEDSYIGYNSLNRPNATVYHVVNAPATVNGGVLRRCIVHHNLMGNFAGVKASKGSVEDCVIWNNKAAGDTSVDNRDVIGGDAKCFTGCSARFAINANCTAIDALPPSAFFGLGMSAGSGFAPHAVRFTAAAGESSYTWDFGDGSAPVTTSEPTVSHVYETVGAYTPTVACGGKTLRAAERIHAFGRPHAVSTMADLVDALDNSVDGLVVDVASGTYVPTTLMCLFDAVEVRGAGLIGTGATVINGNGKGQRAFYLRHPAAYVHDLVLQNFVPPGKGQGVTAYVVAGTVSNCVVRGCTHNTTYGSVTMTVGGNDALVTHCVLTNNTISKAGSGQALAVDVSAGRLENSLIAFNDGKSKAKTYPVRISGGSIVNCTIVDNVNSVVGGVYATGGSVTNCVIAGNLSGATAADNDIQQGTEGRFVACASIGEKAFNGTCYAGTAVQLFANYPLHDYAPAEGSPLVDHGAEVAPVAATDLRGNVRIQGKAIDIGCYEAAVADRSVTFTPAASDAFAGKAAAFTATLSGIDDPAGLAFDWDFDGDGTLDLIDGGMEVSHVYTDYGLKTVSVYVRDGEELLLEKTRENIVSIHPEEIYVVTKTTNAVPPYASWATAAATLNDAVAVAVDGMRIVLTNGTHTVSSSIVLDRKIEVVGAGEDPSDVTLKRSGQNVYVIYLQHPDAVVSGVRLDGGGQNGCVWIYAAGGTVTNSILYNGVSAAYEDDYGAGYVASTNGRITHCRITNCRRTKAGGRNYACVLRNHGFVDNCLFDHNQSVVGNAETMGVIHNAGEIRNCTIVTNTGIAARFLYNAAGARVVNSILSDNVTGGVLESHVLGSGEITNTLIDVSSETLFVDPAAGDWHLRKFCPAVDVVKVSADEAAGTDLDGRPRLLGRRLDLGCYESLPVPGLMLLVR